MEIESHTTLKRLIFIIGISLYSILCGVGFYLLYISRTGQSLDTPWQTIHPYYIYVFFGATLILGLNVWLSDRKFLPYLLFFLIVHSVLLHSYLPLTHKLIYGADQWRHMANEGRLMDGKSFLKPNITSERQSFIQRLDPGLISYAQLWGITIFVARIFSVDLLVLNVWLVPIIWSIAFPLLLYGIGRAIGWDQRKSLGLVFLSFLPFTWAAGGSLTLPNSLGFLWFLVLFLCLLKRLQTTSSRKLYLVLSSGLIISLFGYILYALIFIIVWGLAEILIGTKQTPGIKKNIIQIGVVIMGALAIPLGEVVARYSFFSIHHPWLSEFKQMIGNFTASYLAAGPRPHDIDRGNIIFNQTPLSSFVPNIFMINRWWLVIFMLVFLGLVLKGVLTGIKNRQNIFYYYLSLGNIIFTTAYIIGRYVLDGEQILSRRLEHVIALFWVLSFVIGCEAVYALLKNYSLKFKYAVVVCVVVVLSIAISASYTLGPDIHALSIDEYEAVQYIWNQEKDDTEHCIVGDTYPLLALEALSHKNIIGGGFPIDQFFQQPEEVSAFKELKSNPREEVWRRALDVTKVNTCWLIIDKNVFHETAFSNHYKNDMMFFGEVVVWKYTGPSQSLKIKN